MSRGLRSNHNYKYRNGHKRSKRCRRNNQSYALNRKLRSAPRNYHKTSKMFIFPSISDHAPQPIQRYKDKKYKTPTVTVTPTGDSKIAQKAIVGTNRQLHRNHRTIQIYKPESLSFNEIKSRKSREQLHKKIKTLSDQIIYKPMLSY